ncbi:MAG TPA: NTP transferase domain-containing protein [Candidatus Angelobacter sp.]|nr:NTP transferase domain-containing protein [Candidatus Angelobacter sp.]
MSTTAGLVLAAGEGRRFGGPKAPYVVDGERLVDRAVRVLQEASCAPVVVVLGAWVGDVPGADVVVNRDWASGMGSSLRVGLDHLRALDGVDRVVVTLVDLPGLTAEAVRRVGRSATDLASATYDGVRGHPVLLGRAHWAGAAAAAVGDRGARDYLAAQEVDLVEVGDVASDADLDLPLA